MASNADRILNAVLQELHLGEAEPRAIYQRITEIVDRLQQINQAEKIAVGTTGTITERLCEYGLRTCAQGCYFKLGRDWKWIGDFYVQGAPFNTIITVKSFKAKERLLSSGTGNLLSPTIGYGLFDDPREWRPARMESYLFRAFFMIYMPERTLNGLSEDVRHIKNINGNLFLRSLDRFTDDLQGAIVKGLLDPRAL